MFPQLPNTQGKSSLFSISKPENSKTNLDNSSSDESSEEETTKIPTGAEFFELVDRLYRCDRETMNEIKKLIPEKKIRKVFQKDSHTYLMKTAENLSYFPLAFVANFFYAPRDFFYDDFIEDLSIIEVFIEKLKECTLEDFEIKRLLVALLRFNFGGIEKAVLNSGNARLIRVLYQLMMKHGRLGPYDPVPTSPLNEKGETSNSSEEE